MLGLARLHRTRRLILLFAVMVLLPAGIFSVLIIRAVRSDQMQAAQQKAERQRQIVRLLGEDLKTWVFSAHEDSALSEALFRFQLEGDRIVFPEFHLSLPAKGSPPRPPEPTPRIDPPTAQVITDFYYPRIMVFLRDRGGRRKLENGRCCTDSRRPAATTSKKTIE